MYQPSLDAVGRYQPKMSFATHRRAKRDSTMVPESNVEKRVTRIIISPLPRVHRDEGAKETE